MKWKYDIVCTVAYHRDWKWIPICSLYNQGTIIPWNLVTSDVAAAEKGYDIIISWGRMNLDISLWKDKDDSQE